MSADELAHSDAILSEYGIVLPSPACEAPAPNLSQDQLLHRLISVRIWKHLIVILPVLGLSAGLAVAFANPGVPTTVDVTQQNHWIRGLEGLAGVLVLLAGQMCVLISWVRSRSAVDFRGRYRAWGRLAILLTAGGAALATGVIPYLGDAVATVLRPVAGPINAARPALVLVPLTLLTTLVAVRILIDMNRNRIAQLLMGLSVGLFAACTAGAVVETSVLIAGRVPAGILLGAGLLFSACLLHCRFVVHRNNDPPISRRMTPVHPQIPRETQPVRTAELVSATAEAVVVSAAESTIATGPVAEARPVADGISEESTKSAGKRPAGKSGRRKVA